MSEKIVTACVLIIGNEILSGRTRDANLAFLGERLNALGVRLLEARVIPDQDEVIVETLNRVRRRTHDDITAECVARAFEVPLIQHPEARAILIENPVSRAPGFQIGNVFVMAGIPAVMRAMFESLQHRLTGGLPLLSKAVVAALPESILAPGLSAIQGRYPEVEIGSYPFYRMRVFGVRLVLRATAAERLKAAAGEVRELVRGLGGKPEDQQDS
jgi:molybdopterin-biosynthesis enzyme MoeA-like protein